MKINRLNVLSYNNTDGIAIKLRIARLQRKLRKTDFLFLKYVHGSVMK